MKRRACLWRFEKKFLLSELRLYRFLSMSSRSKPLMIWNTSIWCMKQNDLFTISSLKPTSDHSLQAWNVTIPHNDSTHLISLWWRRLPSAVDTWATRFSMLLRWTARFCRQLLYLSNKRTAMHHESLIGSLHRRDEIRNWIIQHRFFSLQWIRLILTDVSVASC